MKKNSFLRFTALLFCALFAAPAFALASTAPGSLEPLISDNLALAATGVIAVLELVMRLKPTEKDYSFINFAIRVLNTLVPNRAVSKTSGLKGIFKPVIFKSLKK